MKPLGNILANFSTHHYKLVIFVTVLFTLITGSFFPQVSMDTDPENMLETDEPARLFHNETKRRFNLSDTVVVGVVNENHPDGVFNPETLTRIYELTEFARTLHWQDESHPDQSTGIIEIDMIAPSMIDHMSQQGPGTIKFEWLMPTPPKTKQEALAIRDKVLSNPMLTGYLVSEDGKALCLYLPLTDKLLSYRVYTELRKKIDQLGGDETYHITGLPVAEGAIGVEMFTQMGTATPLAMAVIFGLLFLFFRKWFLIILPMIIATVSIVSTMGLMIAFGFPVHILSSMLPIFLMSIAMVDSVHVLSEFFDVYTKSKGRKQTIKEVINTLFKPMLYTSLTTAVGFLSLTLAPIPPARIFGIFLSIGIIIAWVVTVTLVPAYIMIIPERKLECFGLAAQEMKKQNWLTTILSTTGTVTSKHAKPILLFLTILVVGSIWGISQIQVNDNYGKRFSGNHPLRLADIALNKHFAGTYTAYLTLKSKAQESILTEHDVEKLATDLIRFGNEIDNEYPGSEKLATRVVGQFLAIGKKHQRPEDFITSAMNSIEQLATNMPDEEYYALQELKNFLGIEKEKRKLFKRPEVLAYMVDLQAHMEQTGLIGKSQSVADVVRKVNQELQGGKDENFRIPEKLQSVSECYMQYQQSHHPYELWHMVTPDYMQANIRMQFPTGDSMNTKAAVKAVEEYFSHNPPPVELSYRWAGLHYINLVLEARLVNGFLMSLIGSFIIVFIMMSFLFRSPLWGLLCMLPLTITLLFIYGIIGITGKDYDLPVAVLSALSIGMAVDFAIHFLQRSRSIYKEIGSWQEVLPKMFAEPARAISRNMLVIAIGFLPLTVASLVPYKVTGIMLCMILLCSGIITLIVLPAVLTVAEKLFFKNIRS